MPLFEVQHTNWVGFTEYTLVNADSKDEAQAKFEENYDAHDFDPKQICPDALNVEIVGVERYPMKNFNRGGEDAFDIID